MHAGALAGAFLLAALIVQVCLLPSGALVALATLRHGGREGLRVMTIAGSFAIAVHFALVGSVVPITAFALAMWLPCWGMAVLLRHARQQAWPLVFAALLVGAYAVIVRVAVGDVTAFWAGRLKAVFDVVAADTGTRLAPQQIALIAGQMHSWSLIVMLCLFVGTILLARWWQAALFNPGGFGAEFRALALPRATAVLMLLAAAAVVANRVLALGVEIVGDVLLILVVLFAFQGLAVVHHRARSVSLAAPWLVGLYVLLLFVPQIAGPLLAMTGLADSVGDLRGLRRRDGGEA